MAEETSVVAAWIASTLLAKLPDTGVYEGIAPVGATEPYIVFSLVVAPSTLTATGDTVLVRADVDVKAVCEGGSFSPLTPLSEAAYSALHGARYEATDTGMVLACRRTDAIRFTETTGGKVYRHLGGTYRIESQG